MRRLAGVAERVGQRLLDDPVDRHVEAMPGRPRRAVDLEHGRQAGLADPVDEASQLRRSPAAGRGRPASSSSLSAPGAGAARAIASRPVASTASSDASACVGRRRDDLAGRAGLDDHHADGVRDDVVELAGHMPALLGGRRAEPRLALAQRRARPPSADAPRVEPARPRRRRRASHDGTRTTNGRTSDSNGSASWARKPTTSQAATATTMTAMRVRSPVVAGPTQREAGQRDARDLDPRALGEAAAVSSAPTDDDDAGPRAARTAARAAAARPGAASGAVATDRVRRRRSATARSASATTGPTSSASESPGRRGTAIGATVWVVLAWRPPSRGRDRHPPKRMSPSRGPPFG